MSEESDDIPLIPAAPARTTWKPKESVSLSNKQNRNRVRVVKRSTESQVNNSERTTNRVEGKEPEAEEIKGCDTNKIDKINRVQRVKKVDTVNKVSGTNKDNENKSESEDRNGEVTIKTSEVRSTNKTYIGTETDTDMHIDANTKKEDNKDDLRLLKDGAPEEPTRTDKRSWNEGKDKDEDKDDAGFNSTKRAPWRRQNPARALDASRSSNSKAKKEASDASKSSGRGGYEEEEEGRKEGSRREEEDEFARERIEREVEVVPLRKKEMSRVEILYRELKRQTYSFRINREKAMAIGSKVVFRFFEGEELTYSAKGKGVKLSRIYIKRGEEPHIRGASDGVIAVSGINTKTFELSEGAGGDGGRCLMRAEIKPGGIFVPRTFRVKFQNGSAPGYPEDLLSREPTYNEEKKVYQLDFYGKFVITSIRNCILDGPGMKRAFIIRKTTKDDLEIEALREINPLVAFGIAIADFIA